VPILCHFAEFAKLRGSTDLHSASRHIEEFAMHWLAEHGSHRTVPEARSKIAEEARNPVRQMLRLALEGHVIVSRTRKAFPFDNQAPGFLQYLREERGLREATIYKYVHCLNGFAGYLKRSNDFAQTTRGSFCSSWARWLDGDAGSLVRRDTSLGIMKPLRVVVALKS